VSDRDKEMVTLQLRHGDRDAGPEWDAWLDMRDDEVGKELRKYLLDAMSRKGYRLRTIGEFTLLVRRGTRVIHEFVTVAKDDDR